MSNTFEGELSQTCSATNQRAPGDFAGFGKKCTYKNVQRVSKCAAQRLGRAAVMECRLDFH